MAARSAEVAGDPVVRVEALALVARCYFLEDNLADGRSWLEQAEGLAQASEPLGWSRCRQVRGILTRAEGNTDKALEIFEGLYDFCREKGLYERALDAAHHLALLAPLDGQVVWAKRAITAAEAGGDESLLAILWNNLGLTYEKMLRPTESLTCYRRARWYHYRTGDGQEKWVADWAVGRALRMAARNREALLWLRDVVERAEAMWRDTPGEQQAEWRAFAWREYGEVQLELGLYKEAQESLERARLAFLAVGSGDFDWVAFQQLLDRADLLARLHRQ